MVVEEPNFIESCFKRLEMIQQGIDRVEDTQEENFERLENVDIHQEKNRYETKTLLQQVMELKNAKV